MQEFKGLMAQHPELRIRLETTVRNNQQANNNAQMAKETAKTNSEPQKPTIQLKTDFSNFHK